MTHSLFELNEFIKRVIAANLNEAIWINAEISQSSQSRGHWYIELIEKDGETNQIIAQAQAILWKGNFRLLQQKIGKSIHQILNQGTDVKLKVKADFSERYGLKLIIEDIDTKYTLGQLELKKRAILEQLAKEQAFEKQKAFQLPLVIQRIAVISSATAAGYIDFTNQLNSNEYNYGFEYELFNTSMQGQLTEDEFVLSMNKIMLRKEEFDVIAVIRGGGSKLDLAAFDALKIGQAIAASTLPVLTGIGHEIDTSIADLVAHTQLKTPTAVADFLINKMIDFESTMNYLYQKVEQIATNKIYQEEQRLNNLNYTINKVVEHQLYKAEQMLSFIENQISNYTTLKIQKEEGKLLQLEQAIALLDPKYTFKRGYTMTLVDGKIPDKTTLTAGTEIVTYFSEEESIKSKII